MERRGGQDVSRGSRKKRGRDEERSVGETEKGEERNSSRIMEFVYIFVRIFLLISLIFSAKRQKQFVLEFKANTLRSFAITSRSSDIFDTIID